MDVINIRKISDEQAKKEIVKYLSHIHERCFDASNIQTDLSIDISQAITILDELERDGKIKGKGKGKAKNSTTR